MTNCWSGKAERNKSFGNIYPVKFIVSIGIGTLNCRSTVFKVMSLDGIVKA